MQDITKRYLIALVAAAAVVTMAALIQEVSLAARRTFANSLKDPAFQERFNELVKLMSRVRSRDVNFNVALTQRNIGRGDCAPVTYIHLFEDQYFSMGIFVLRENARIPLHDHPGMYGLIKVIHGRISVKSFDHVIIPPEDDPSSTSSSTTANPTSGKSSSHFDVSFKKLFSDSAKNPRPFLDVPHREATVNDDCCILTPTKGNIHEVRSSGGAAAFLDILAPPYDMETADRRCFYYEKVSTKITPTSALLEKYPNNQLQWLVQVQQPSDFWCDEAEYEGPELP